jgi:hypothetical protein
VPTSGLVWRRTSEDANAHLQHFLKICSTFTIQGVTQDAIRLHLFPFSLLGEAKQWFYSNKEVVSTWEKCSNAFLTKFFPLGKPNALRNKISGFQQLTDETITEAWERLQYYISACPHHGMEEWFIIQSFYHVLICSAREHIEGNHHRIVPQRHHKPAMGGVSAAQPKPPHAQRHAEEVHV